MGGAFGDPCPRCTQRSVRGVQHCSMCVRDSEADMRAAAGWRAMGRLAVWMECEAASSGFDGDMPRMAARLTRLFVQLVDRGVFRLEWNDAPR